MQRCDICDGLLVIGVADWHFECPQCGTECSSLRPAINAASTGILRNEDQRARGLGPLRQEGYWRLLGHLRELRGGTGGSLLEIGSAHAWFLRAACGEFDRSVGIEPDDAVRQVPCGPSVEVRAGYFPRLLAPDETFDVVAFNDVFEHIPAARETCAAVVRALKRDGIAVINIPVSKGTLYRIASVLYRLGMPGPFERMWQKDFPSPHLYYFPEGALVRLFREAGCTCERIIPMPTLRVRGLWARIRYAEPRLLAALCTFACSLLIAPIIAVLPADVKCFFFRKRSE